MTENQKHLFDLVCEIDAICRNNGIEYHFMAGTLIGAIRHEGFLPWDDDADIFMTYAEFQKFVKACETDLPENRALMVPGKTMNYTNNFPRYIALDSTAIHSSQVLSPDDALGTVIDIFVLDPIKDGQENWDAYTRDLMIYCDVTCYAAPYARRYGVSAEELQAAFDLEKKLGRAAFCEYYENKLASYFSDDGSYYVARWGGIELFYPRWMFSETVECMFEGRSFLAPKHFNEYLRQHYGDEWTSLPTHAERMAHDAAYSLKVPASRALDLYKPRIPREELRAAMGQRSVLECEAASEFYAISDEHQKVYGWIRRLELEKRIAESPEEFAAALGEKDGRALAPFMDEFIAWQLHRDRIGREHWYGGYRMHHPFLAEVTDEQREAMLWTLLCTERLGWARRYLEVIKKNRGGFTAAEQLVSDALDVYASGTDAYWLGDFATALSVAEELLKSYPNNDSFLKLQLNSMFQLGGVSYEGFMEALEYAESIFPDDGFFMKYRADVLEQDGRQEEAIALYRECLEHTCNGMIHLAVKKKTGFIPRWIVEEFGPDDNAYAIDLPVVEESANDLEKPDPALEKRDAIKQCFFDTLCALTSFCDARGISYWLNPVLSQCMANLNITPNAQARYGILLTPANMQKLINALSDNCPEGYAFDALGVSEKYASTTLRFYDASTTAFDFVSTTWTSMQSIYVTARMISSSSYADLNSVSFRRFRELQGYSVKYGDGELSFLTAFNKRIEGMTMQEVASLVLRERVGLYKKFSLRRYIDATGQKRSFPVFAFCGKKRIAFQGANFSVVPGTQMLYRMFGSKFFEYKTERMFANSTVVSLDIPFTQVKEASAYDEDLQVRRRALSRQRKSAEKVHDLFNKAFDDIKRAVALKEVSLEVLPLKNEVLAASQGGQQEIVLALMDSYVQYAVLNASRIDLNFDDELYRALKTALAQSGDEKLMSTAKRIDAFEDRLSSRIEMHLTSDGTVVYGPIADVR